MFGSDVAAALPELRREAESLMTDTCRIDRPTGSTLDPQNHQQVTIWALVWSGPCRARVTSADRTETLRLQVSIPVDAPAPLVGHRITITDAVFDSSLEDEVVFVTEAPVSSQAVLRRLSAERGPDVDRR